MNHMLRHQGKFQCFVLILALVGQLSVSGFWPFLCPFGCTYFFFFSSFTACDCLVILCHNKTKHCRPCYITSYITWDTEAPGPLNNTYFKLQLRILTHYSPFTLLVTAIYTKCFFLLSICVTTKLSRINNGNRTD